MKMRRHHKQATAGVIVLQVLSFFCTIWEASSFRTVHTHILSPKRSHPQIRHADDVACKYVEMGRRTRLRASFHLSPLAGKPVDSFMALSTIGISSAAGWLCNEKGVLGGNAGTIITLLSAALLSNIGLFGLVVPTSHYFYDICWEKLLPASLALVLLSASNNSSVLGVAVEERKTYQETIAACGVSFWIGSIGSILGCLLSAVLFTKSQSMKSLEAAIAAGKDKVNFIDIYNTLHENHPTDEI